MRTTVDADEYFAAPAGMCLTRRRFVCASPDGELFSLVAWGELDVEDTEELLEVLAAAGRHPRRRRQLVVLRDVERVSMASMAMWIRYFTRAKSYLASVEREAVVRPNGLVGVLAEGFYGAVPHPFEGRVFVDIDAAVRWLGFSPEREPYRGWIGELSSLGGARAADVVARVHAVVVERGARVTPRATARELGVSTRTLQRRLAVAGTTFELERGRAATIEAKRRLLTSDADIKHVAFDLGYASASRFVEAFRRHTGVPPGRWRETHQPGGDANADGV